VPKLPKTLDAKPRLKLLKISFSAAKLTTSSTSTESSADVVELQ
jgi:hypothetical protein